MRKLVALLLCMVLCFSLVTNAGATDLNALMGQLRSQNSGEVAFPELADTHWYMTQLSKGEEVEPSGLYGFWDSYQFNPDGTGYALVARFDGLSGTVDFTWAKTDTKAEMIIKNQTVELNYDGRFLSYTDPSSGVTTHMVSYESDQELYMKVQSEMYDLSYSPGMRTEDVYLNGLYKPMAVFFINENGALQYYMYNDLTIQVPYLLEVNGGYEGKPCDIFLYETTGNFGHVANCQQGYDAINGDASLKMYAAYGIAPENCSVSNVTLQAAEGEERVITSFHQQEWVDSYVLQMGGVYFICMPLY